MHELSIAMGLVDAVSEQLIRLGDGSSARRVLIRVGRRSAVDPEALLFAFDAAVDDTPLAGARLEIERTDGRALELTAVEVVGGRADCRGLPEHSQKERSRGSTSPRSVP